MTITALDFPFSMSDRLQGHEAMDQLSVLRRIDNGHIAQNAINGDRECYDYLWRVHGGEVFIVTMYNYVVKLPVSATIRAARYIITQGFVYIVWIENGKQMYILLSLSDLAHTRPASCDASKNLDRHSGRFMAYLHAKIDAIELDDLEYASAIDYDELPIDDGMSFPCPMNCCNVWSPEESSMLCGYRGSKYVAAYTIEDDFLTATRMRHGADDAKARFRIPLKLDTYMVRCNGGNGFSDNTGLVRFICVIDRAQCLITVDTERGLYTVSHNIGEIIQYWNNPSTLYFTSHLERSEALPVVWLETFTEDTGELQ